MLMSVPRSTMFVCSRANQYQSLTSVPVRGQVLVLFFTLLVDFRYITYNHMEKRWDTLCCFQLRTARL